MRAMEAWLYKTAIEEVCTTNTAYATTALVGTTNSLLRGHDAAAAAAAAAAREDVIIHSVDSDRRQIPWRSSWHLH